MEESGNSALRIAGGVIITVLVITLAFGIYTLAKGTSTSAKQQINRLSGQMSESIYTQYEGVEVSGSEVINIIKQFDKDDVVVEVVIGSATADYGGSSGTGTLSDATDRSSTNYINPNSMFLGSIERSDDTDAIQKLVFTKQ